MLQIRFSAAEFKRLPRVNNRSGWGRNILLKAAAGVHAVGPDPAELHQLILLRSYLGALLDELLRGQVSELRHPDVISEIARLLETEPRLFLNEEDFPCS